jgi:glucose 1-dehydrogenase
MSGEQYPDVVMPECPAEKILERQKALVTGGASGIGRAVAIALGKAGADVVVNYVSGEDQANEVAAGIGKCGSRAYAHQADVSSEDQVKKMFQKMFQDFGTIDILINNAGLQKDAPFDEMTVDQWNIVINVNLTGQFLCAREAVREFKRRGVVKAVSCAAGKIICMSSVHEIIPWDSSANINNGTGQKRDPSGFVRRRIK